MNREEEIEMLVGALREAMLKNKSLRMGQLVTIITNKWNGKNDSFYIPDSVMLSKLIEAKNGTLFERDDNV